MVGRVAKCNTLYFMEGAVGTFVEVMLLTHHYMFLQVMCFDIANSAPLFFIVYSCSDGTIILDCPVAWISTRNLFSLCCICVEMESLRITYVDQKI